MRHKVLDCLGDIFMAGYRINGKVNAFKSGHELNNKLMRSLFSNRENWCIMPFQNPKIQFVIPSITYLLSVKMVISTLFLFKLSKACIAAVSSII